MELESVSESFAVMTVRSIRLQTHLAGWNH